MSTENLCNILFCGHLISDPEDDVGCHLPTGHDDYHEFIASDGRKIKWTNGARCGIDCTICGDSEDSNDWCLGWYAVKKDANTAK